MVRVVEISSFIVYFSKEKRPINESYFKKTETIQVERIEGYEAKDGKIFVTSNNA